MKLFQYNTVLELFNKSVETKQDVDDSDLDDSDDMKDNEPELTKIEVFELYRNCRDRVWKDVICGIFNRFQWRFLTNPLTLRNKLRLTLNTTQTKFSSLQVHE